MPTGQYSRVTFKPLAERLSRKTVINEETGCWEWRGSKTSFGHGQLYKGGPASGGRRLLMAHRASWVVHKGEIPDGLCVLHRCDNPSCINPDHLFLGTKADNTADMIAKNRQKRGEDLPQAGLTRVQVEAIRLCTLTQKEIATIAGISQSAVCNIKAMRSWNY